jgi:hypothetical protein
MTKEPGVAKRLRMTKKLGMTEKAGIPRRTHPFQKK